MSKKKSRKEYITGYNQWTSTRNLEGAKVGECIHGNNLMTCHICKRTVPKFTEDVRNELLEFTERELDEAIDKLAQQPDFYEKNVKGQLVDGEKDIDPKVAKFWLPATPPERFKELAGIEPDPGNYCDDCRDGKSHDVHVHSTVSPCVAVGDLFDGRYCKNCLGQLPEFAGMHQGRVCTCDDNRAVHIPDEPKKPMAYAYTGYNDIDEFLDECLETMRAKGHDYRQGNDDDLLHNFRTVADTVGVDIMKVWFTYFYKHYSAMATFIKEGGQSESEPIEGRIKDQIVYLLLFYRMVQEKKNAADAAGRAEHGVIS